LSEVFNAECHDEISANIVALLQVRQQWLGAKSDSERSEIEKINPLFDFYFEALKKGKITTDHKTVQDFDEEMRCITEGVQSFWFLLLINDYYEQIIECVRDYFKAHDYEDIASNKSYYNMYCENVYRIGGLDFREYGLEHIDIFLASTEMEYADKLVKAGVDRKSIHDFFDTLLVDKDKAYQKASELEKKERQTDENLQREGVFVQRDTEFLLKKYDNHESINLYKVEIIDFRSGILFDLRDALIKKENFEKEQMLLNEKKIKKGVNLRKKLSESDFFQKIKVIRKIKEKRRADGLKEIHPSKRKQKNNIRLYRNQGKGE
jgi:hypothetical protein